MTTALDTPEVDLIAVPHPFSMARTQRRVRAGGTLADLVALAGVQTGEARVLIERDGKVYGPIRKQHWRRVRPRPGSRVLVRATMFGGGGGSDNKTWRLIIQIVIWLVALVIIVASWGTLTWVAIIWVVGMTALTLYVINPLLPLPMPKIKPPPTRDWDTKDAGRTQSLTGSRNHAAKYGPIPVVYGQHRIFPPFGADPFTEIVGDDQYLRQLFVVGYGPLTLTDLKIGETPLASFAGVEYEVREGYDHDAPITLYTNDVAEEPLAIVLTYAGGAQTRTGQQPADEISVDIAFPQGLATILQSGAITTCDVTIRVEYRAVGAGSWTLVADLVCSDAKLSLVRRGLRWATPATDSYEVRLTRLTGDYNDIMIHDQSVWGALRTIRKTSPVVVDNIRAKASGGGVCMVALRIKATDQLNGVVDRFNCLAQAILPDWDNGTQQWVTRATASPAAAYRAALQGAGNARPVADARLHLPSLQQWAVDAAAAGFTFNQVIDFRHTVLDQLRDIAGAGRAAFTMVDGKFGVVEDREQTVPVQHFTPRNSFNFHGRRAFGDIPHALKVRFVNPDQKWQQDERIVYDDGYNEGNATRYEVMDTVGITNPDQAWKLGRYHLAALRLRYESFEFAADMENLICTRGDLIRLTHDVILVGYCSGRILSVQTSGPNCTGITVDEECVMVLGGSYGVRMRYSDGSSVVKTVVTNPGAQKVLAFATPFPTPFPAAGDLFLFGESGLESIECIVKEVAHDRDLVARILVLPHSPAIYDADSGPIPPYDSGITLPPEAHRGPSTPVILDVRSDESVLVRDLDGSLSAQILLSLGATVAGAVPTDYLEVQYRRSDSGSAYTALARQEPMATEVGVRPVDQGIAYDIRIRAVSDLGSTSDWATVLNHTVVGKSTPPPDATDLVVIYAAEGNRLSWQYPVIPRDFAGFQVRIESGVGERWETALPLFGHFVTPTVFVLPILYGTWTFYVKGTDTSGNESENAGEYTFDFGDPRVQNIVEEFDQEPTWAGTKTGCEVSGDDLVALSASAFWTTNGSLFWTADANTFWTGGFADMLYEFSATTSADAEGCRGMFEWMVQGEGWALEYQEDGDAGWIGWPGQLSPVKGSQTYNFRAALSGGSVQGIMSQLDFIVDAPEQTDVFSNVAIADTGTRLTLPRTYRGITIVQATAIEDAGTGITARVVDRDEANGPLIKVLDAAGTAVAGHVDATIVGY